MSDRPAPDKIALSLSLPPSLAARIEAAARAQGRSAASYVIDLLERHVPRLPPEGQKKLKIPYS